MGTDTYKTELAKMIMEFDGKVNTYSYISTDQAIIDACTQVSQYLNMAADVVEYYIGKYGKNGGSKGIKIKIG